MIPASSKGDVSSTEKHHHLTVGVVFGYFPAALHHE